MRHLVLLLVAVLPSVAAEPGFVPLFDGRTLDGWHITGSKPGFSVKDGCIYSVSPAGADWLATDREYTNFELQLEWQISAVGNSGIMVRNAFEVQLLAPWTPYRDDLHCTASLYGHVAPQKRPSEEGLRWRTLAIIARNDRLEVYVDGELCTRADLSTVPSLAKSPYRGPIMLQDSHSKAGEWVMFRNLRIRDLDADPALVLDNFRSDDARRRALVPAVAARVGASLVVPALAAIEAGEQPYARLAAEVLDRLGGAADRAAVEAAALEWLDGHGVASRRAAIDLLGRIGGQRCVPALAHALAVPALRDAALRALVRNPHAAATRALTAAPAALDVVAALAERRDPLAAGPLAVWSKSGETALRQACLRALGACGDPYAAPVLTAAIHEPELASAAIDGLLAMADGLPAGEAQRVWLYDQAWCPAADASQQARALAGWLDASPEAWPVAVAALDDPTLADAAATLLLRTDGAALGDGLVEQLKSGDLRPVYLRWLALHRPHDLKPYLLEAMAAGLDEALGYELLAGIADESLLDLLRRAARTLDAAARDHALDGLLAIAETRRRDGRAADSAALFAEVLDSRPNRAARRQAILGLGATGDTLALPRLVALLDVDRAGAAKALLRLSLRLGREPRIELLTGLVRRTPPVPFRDEMLAALSQLGIAIDLGHEQGFITRWWLQGPLPGRGDPKIEQAALAAGGPDLSGWRPHHETKSREGVMEFGELLKPTQEQTVYCYAEVSAPQETAALLKLGSDDGYALWLNGDLVGERPTGRMLKVDDETHEVVLRQGINRIVFKVMNGGSRWAGVVRLTTRQGDPLVLAQRER